MKKEFYNPNEGVITTISVEQLTNNRFRTIANEKIIEMDNILDSQQAVMTNSAIEIRII